MPHPHQPYPALDLECVTEIVRMVRGRTVRDEIKWFAKHVYNLTGAGLSFFPGEPDDVTPIFGGEAAEPTVEQVQECKAALEQAQGELQSFGADENEAIDPATIAMLIQLAVTLITKWLERRKPA